MSFKRLVDLDLMAKRVLIRQDLNVPLRDGEITSATRIEASLPTIKLARDAGAKVMLMSHLGRPVEDQVDNALSLKPIAQYLSKQLGQLVSLNKSYLDTAPQMQNGDVVLMENVRFNVGEKSDNEDLSKKYAALCDIYVMDAFGTAHRAQASTHGVGLFAPIACAGPLFSAELDALSKALSRPARPLVAIVGGAKVSTKLTVLEALSGIVDQLVPGGGIANTFIAAAGYSVGKSLYEPELVDQAQSLMHAAQSRGGSVPVPVDVVVAKAFSEAAEAVIKTVEDVQDDDLILDVGPKTAEQYAGIMSAAGTIVWNGPVGVFEIPQFSNGTQKIGKAIASSNAFSIAGGGDTLAAIDKYDLSQRVSYISTGGGAFLEFLGGKKLPAVVMLEARNE